MPDDTQPGGPRRILFIRHAEQHETPGYAEDGVPDDQSLTIRGWQRAGALARRLRPADGRSRMTPDSVFASGVGPESESRRPRQTVAPLLALLRAEGDVETCFTFLKHDTKTLMAEVMTRSGVVLVAWEHSQIAKCIDALPHPPAHPPRWSDDRYDLIWVLDREGDGWTFTEEAQMVLADDALA